LLPLLPDGKLEAIGYVAEEGGVTSKVKNVVNMARLFRCVELQAGCLASYLLVTACHSKLAEG
jgi:hypothetical protein